MYSTFSCGAICVKVSQLLSLWGRNRDDQGWTNREGRENKHWKHGQNRTLLELELNCPAGTSGTAVTPGVIEWSLTPQRLFIKADSLGGDSQGSIYGRELRPWTIMLNSTKGQSSGQLLLLELTVCLLLIRPAAANCASLQRSRFISLLPALIYSEGGRGCERAG